MSDSKKKGVAVDEETEKILSEVDDWGIIDPEDIPEPEIVVEENPAYRTIIVETSFNAYRRGDRINVEWTDQARSYIEQGMWRLAD